LSLYHTLRRFTLREKYAYFPYYAENTGTLLVAPRSGRFSANSRQASRDLFFSFYAGDWAVRSAQPGCTYDIRGSDTDSDSDFSKYDCVMPLVVLEASKANASPEAVGQPLSRKNEPDERVHGNTGRRGQKSRNEKRDWTEGLWRKRGYTNKTFKVTARRFWQMAKETAPPLEFDDLASPLTVDGSA